MEHICNIFKLKQDSQPSDAVKYAQRVMEVIDGTGMGSGKEEDLFRLAFGSDCYNRFQNKINNLKDDLLQEKDIAHSTGYS